jgi:preprotein translocase subunit SecF
MTAFTVGVLVGIVSTLLMELMVILFWPSKPKHFISMGTFEIEDKDEPK